MPLMLTKKSAYEMQADMTIHIQDNVCPDMKPRGNFIQRYIQRLQGRNPGGCVWYVPYTADAFKKNFTKALQYAARRGYKTIAVSCLNETVFAAANQLGRLFAAEKDWQIWLCLGENIGATTFAVVELEKWLSSNEKRKACKDEFAFFEPIASLHIEESLNDTEEYHEDCAIWEEDDHLAPQAMPSESLPPRRLEMSRPQAAFSPAEHPKSSSSFRAIHEFLKKNDAGFKDTLLKYIDRTGKKESEVYKKANIDRRLFSKIMNVQGYNPSKPTAIAFAIALELNLEETKDLIGRAGYTLSQASTFDRIIEFFILERNFDIYEINEALFYFDQSLLGC